MLSHTLAIANQSRRIGILQKQLISVHTHWPQFTSEFIKDMRSAVDYVKTHPDEQPKGIAKAYGKLENGRRLIKN